MNKKVLSTLEYDKILMMLLEKCETPLGIEEAKKLLPMTELSEIEKAQSETEDALSRIYRFGNISMSGARDIRESFARMKVAAPLSVAELLNIAMVLKTAARVKNYEASAKDNESYKANPLEHYFEDLCPVPELQREIDRVIISEDEIADDASSELFRIRRTLLKTKDKVHDELNRLVVSSGNYLREHVITQRNGRYCLPVRNEYRSQFPGMIHDESGSGSTVFIEPMAVVKLNNEIRELEIAEEKEIARILQELSIQASDYMGALESDLRILSHLDFVFAKARLARDMNATRPVFRKDRALILKSARHPLLDKKKVVPIDIEIGERFRTLMITGPNTGGKTVSLKTTGLLSLMGQAGLHIPAAPLSELSVFQEIFADIGDEQSIEQNLSTFSSHMKNIIEILKAADENSLVLFDELCAGTDPQEGAALAIAILNTLLLRDARTMATTHYSELKLYALSSDGVENACCEFNVATLSPTYHLLIGIPGKSNAFAISQKLGLPMQLIENAKSQMDSDEVAFEDVIRDLNKSKKRLEKDQAKIGKLRYEAKNLTETLEKEHAKLQEEREKILAKAKEEAREILAEAKSQVDETIRALNKAGKDSRDLEKERTKTRELLEKNTKKENNPVHEQRKKTDHEIKMGDRVKILSMDAEGSVIRMPKNGRGKALVQAGILEIEVSMNDLEYLEEERISFEGKGIKGGRFGASGINKAATIETEIKLLGMTGDEALSALDKYIDDAYMAHLPKVRIVHGKGTGVLRNIVQNYLRKHPQIKSYHLAEYGEGDAGVTIAEFK